MSSIQARHRGDKTYYYYHENHRVKVSVSDQGGKGKGSGPSRVVSKAIYLGTAEAILEAVREGPKEVAHSAFGLVMAAWSVVDELGVAEVIDQLVPRRGRGLSVGTYIALAVVAKVAAGKTSWHGFGDWVAKTSLAHVLPLPKNLLDSQNFWDAFDRILPEAAHRTEQASRQEPVLDDEIVLQMEEAIVRRLLAIYPIDLSTLLLDYTNFFTYVAAENPSRLLKAGHNKAGRHEKRQVALALVASRERGMPLLHLTYPGNWNDVQVFPEVLLRLVERLKVVAPPAEHERVIAFDRGQNSELNIGRLAAAHLKAVGGLRLGEHRKLLKLPVETSPETVGTLRVLRTEKKVYGQQAAVVLTYGEKLARKQRLAFMHGIRRLKAEMRRAHKAHVADDPEKLVAALAGVHGKSRFGKYLDWDFRPDGGLSLRFNDAAWQQKKLEFGKRLLFSTEPSLSTKEIVTLYNQDKTQIEDDFKEIKSPDLLRFSPIRHFTDTKVRLYGFVCVIALMVFKLMEYKTRDLNLSPNVLVSELRDIEEILLVYSLNRAQRKLSHCSTVQMQLVNVFNLRRFLPAD